MAARWIPQAAAGVFFFLIFLQIPLFEVPCRTGVCTTPLQVTVGQMASSHIMPPVVIRCFLYPGAVLLHLVKRQPLAPVWGNILQEYNLTESQPASSSYKFRLEVIAGSYFAVGGAVVSLIKPGRMSMFGLLLIIWGLIKDGIFGTPETVRSEPADLVHAEPTLYLALALALLSVRYDMNKIQRIGRPIAKPLRSSTKAKLKSK